MTSTPQDNTDTSVTSTLFQQLEHTLIELIPPLAEPLNTDQLSSSTLHQFQKRAKSASGNEEESQVILSEFVQQCFQINISKDEWESHRQKKDMGIQEEWYQSLLKALFRIVNRSLDKLKHASGASFSDSEIKFYIKYTNEVMAKLNSEWNPINDEDEFFNRFKDGTLFCQLLNHAVGDGLIHEKAINHSTQTFKIMENHNIALKAAKSVGCVVVNINSQQLVECKPLPILSLLWQIIRIDLLNCVRVSNTLQMIILKHENETIREFIKLDPKELLLRWVNYVLNRDQQISTSVQNFSSDFADSRVLSRLLRYVAPHLVSEEQIELIFQKQDEYERAQELIQLIESLPLERAVVISPEDIADGQSRLITACVAVIFDTFGASSLTNDQKLDPETMLQLQSQIVDIAIEDLAKSQPSIRSAEFMDFITAAKALTNTKSEGQQGLLDALKEEQTRASHLEQECQQLKQNIEELQQQDKSSKETIEELNLNVDNLSQNEATLKQKIKELEEENQQLKDLILENENAFDQMKEKIASLEADNTSQSEQIDSQKSKIEQLEGDVTKLNETNESLQNDLTSANSKLEEMQKKEEETLEKFNSLTEESSQVRDSLVDRVQILKEKYVQVRKDLAFLSASTVPPYQAEEKLALWKYGSLNLKDILPRATQTGMVRKRSGGMMKTFKSRFFVLFEDEQNTSYLLYYGDDKVPTASPKGCIRLDECRLEDYQDDCGFIIQLMKKHLKCICPTAEEAKTWRQNLERAGRVVF